MIPRWFATGDPSAGCASMKAFNRASCRARSGGRNRPWSSSNSGCGGFSRPRGAGFASCVRISSRQRRAVGTVFTTSKLIRPVWWRSRIPETSRAVTFGGAFERETPFSAPSRPFSTGVALSSSLKERTVYAPNSRAFLSVESKLAFELVADIHHVTHGFSTFHRACRNASSWVEVAKPGPMSCVSSNTHSASLFSNPKCIGQR
jgi:hypothetical protein